MPINRWAPMKKIQEKIFTKIWVKNFKKNVNKKFHQKMQGVNTDKKLLT